MYKGKKIWLTTGPSVFSTEIRDMVSEFFDGIPLYVSNYKKEELDYLIECSDVLCLSGGSDIAPQTLGRSITHGNSYTSFNYRRDCAELYLLKRAIEKEIGIILICRGAQLALSSPLFGQHLIADLPGNIAHSVGSEIKVNVEVGEFHHYVSILSKFQDYYGHKSMGQLSYHHEGISFDPKENGKNGLEVIATANTSTDSQRNVKIIELAECQDKKMFFNQGHPEVGWKHDHELSIKSLERFKEFLV